MSGRRRRHLLEADIQNEKTSVQINTMKRLLIPLMAASVAIGGAAPVLVSGEPP
jgi:hypothetical protein